MDNSRGSSPVFVVIVICLLVGGGVFFAQRYEVKGLDGLTIRSRDLPDSGAPIDSAETSFVGTSLGSSGSSDGATTFWGIEVPESSPFHSVLGNFTATGDSDESDRERGRMGNLRIASWALSGFGPTKLNQPESRRNLIRIVRQFDVVCLQQITAFEHDFVPRIVSAINEGGQSYDYVLGQPTGPHAQVEQLAILFNTDRVKADRAQTYTVSDPHGHMNYDPLVAWFCASQPSAEAAWTFSVVNVRIDLSRAPSEVALLPGILNSVRSDGRGEDDVVLAGLFQADDAYLTSHVMSGQTVAAVQSTPTDIFGRHQTSNILVDGNHTSEYVGRGGAVDFLKLYDLTAEQAEKVSKHLPVFAEFAPNEGG